MGDYNKIKYENSTIEPDELCRWLQLEDCTTSSIAGAVVITSATFLQHTSLHTYIEPVVLLLTVSANTQKADFAAVHLFEQVQA